MSSPAGMPLDFTTFPNPAAKEPPSNAGQDVNEDGISVRPMRLKVLYTFDDQNKTNCLARGQDVLQIKTVALDETTSIGIVELKTCIEAVIQCSPEIVARLGQADYTVYAYDYSEYDNPLVGQGMLSRALAATSPCPDVPAQQSQKLITGRVCKNILGIFNNGVKETLEVKLRLVPVPTAVQGEYLSAMEKYKELNKSAQAELDTNEWASLMGSKTGWPAPTAAGKRGSVNMEVVNQLLSPSLPPQQSQQQPQQPTPPTDYFNEGSNPANSENEGREISANSGKAKNSRPSSRASVKRPRGRGRSAKPATTGGNTSGYEDGTDGDDGPISKKRAKITKTDWNSKSSFGPATDSLRVAASTAGSLRVFRPIAMNPATNVGSHLQDVPRAPTPVPILPKQQIGRNRAPSQSGLRREPFLYQNEAPRQHISPYPPLQPALPTEDQVRFSVESAGPSPERNVSPADTPPGIGSSPPLMRTCSPMRSSPPCPSSPILPQMPRTDSGFMSGSMEELFGDEDEIVRPVEDEEVDNNSKFKRGRKNQAESKPRGGVHHGFVIEEETPGPMELLPTKMATFKQKAPPKAPKSRAGSVFSEDGQQSLPRLKTGSHPPSRRRTPANQDPEPEPAAAQPQEIRQQSLPEMSQPPEVSQPQEGNHPQAIAPQPPPQSASAPVQPPSRPGSRMMVRTASLGSLTLPIVPASDPVLPPSSLQRSQTWSEAQHPVTEAPMPTQADNCQQGPASQGPNDTTGAPFNRTLNAKKAAIRQKLEQAIANGEMPPFCSNCGAIETPTWRKAWSQEHRGAPGYYEYSDEPGRVTAIVILGRNSEGQPNLYQLIKKFLGPGDNQADWNEFLLCNPCGIWLSKYKSQRPEEKWESNRPKPDKNGADKKGGERKRGGQRASKSKKPNGGVVPTSEANYPPSEAFPQLDNFLPPNPYGHPQSDAFFPPSEAYHPLSEMPGQCISPLETVDPVLQHDFQVNRVEVSMDRERSASSHSTKQPMTDAASAALKRAIQSSPGRWVGTQHSPINVDDGLGSTRRLLFPSPRKDGSPKVLGELTTNVVNISGEVVSPKEPASGTSNKENSPPGLEAGDADADLIKLFETEMSRPKTPVQKSPAPNPFKTPTRPTPSHRPITRSVSKSLRSGKSPRQLLPFSQTTPSRTPGSIALRRSPRNHPIVFESPFTATLNQLMSEADNNRSTPQRCKYDMDFNHMSDLPIMDHPDHHGAPGGMNFSLEDFFSTDVPMPSSPPKAFNLYEDPMTMTDVDWNEFREFENSPVKTGGAPKRDCNETHVKIEGENSEEQGRLDQQSQPTEEQHH